MKINNHIPGYVKSIDKDYVVLQDSAHADHEFRVPRSNPIKMGSTVVAGPGFQLKADTHGNILIFADNTIGFQPHE